MIKNLLPDTVEQMLMTPEQRNEYLAQIWTIAEPKKPLDIVEINAFANKHVESAKNAHADH